MAEILTLLSAGGDAATIGIVWFLSSHEFRLRALENK